MADPNFTRRWFIGEGLDIGGKPDPLSLYVPFFPGLTSVRVWDWEDGDAQFLEGLAPESLDFVHSSHCLEHLVDPRQGLKAWFIPLAVDTGQRGDPLALDTALGEGAVEQGQQGVNVTTPLAPQADH